MQIFLLKSKNCRSLYNILVITNYLILKYTDIKIHHEIIWNQIKWSGEKGQ